MFRTELAMVVAALAVSTSVAVAGSQSSNSSSNTSSDSSNERTTIIHREDRSYVTDRGGWRRSVQSERREYRGWRDRADDDDD